MKQLFLTSSASKVAHSLARRIEIAGSKNLVFIDTAAEPEEGDKTWLADDRQALVEVGFEVEDYTITGKTKEQLEEDLHRFDFLYLSGGNTFYLLQQSQQSGFIDLVREYVTNQNKTYIGSSAGSIIAGSKCPDYLLETNEVLELEKHTGYNLVNFTILPHWGSEYFRELYLRQRLEMVYKSDQVPLLILTDSQYVHVKDDYCQIIDIAKE